MTALSDDLLARTRSIDAADCIDAGPVGLVEAPVGGRRRVIVGVLALAVVVAATGGVYAFARRDATAVRIETTLPPSTAATPTTKAPTASEFAAALPDCVPVDDTRGETRGCVSKALLNGGLADDRVPPGMPGLPVYSEPGGPVVGYEVIGVGFVPLSVSDDPAALAHLTTCVTMLTTGALDGSPELPGCIPALVEFGIPDPVAAAHEAVTSKAEYQKLRQEQCRAHPSQPVCAIG